MELYRHSLDDRYVLGLDIASAHEPRHQSFSLSAAQANLDSLLLIEPHAIRHLIGEPSRFDGEGLVCGSGRSNRRTGSSRVLSLAQARRPTTWPGAGLS